ncbi:hypothetical protein [Helicobacter canis]|uniref:Uncharacterized protein n=1 Tax=Helicobacter canis TaxID=29419 RepID=A0A5M9QLI0_9HELI|nr:hypothetical protein [Helicobacter canis]KAA8707815.1 hypothetical protein F4V45_08085 [Helicobacter canis]
MRATQALLSLLAKYATFLRYCVVGVMASGVFYGVANLSALLSKVDSRSEAQNLESTFENAQNAGKLAQDSSKQHQTLNQLAQDSNASTQNAQNLETPQAAGFCDDFVGCQGGGEGIYLSGNEQALAADSRKSAQKPTPELSLATLLGSLASFIFGYFAQMRLAFRAYPNHSTMLPRYLALLALIAIYAQAITYLGAFFTLSYYLISAFIALSVPLFSYPLQKLWVFAKTSKGGGRHIV